MVLKSLVLAVPLLVLTAGCGSSSPRILQIVTASPATADAKLPEWPSAIRPHRDVQQGAYQGHAAAGNSLVGKSKRTRHH